MRLANKVAIVTGAASGIGRGIAFGLAREGCDVMVIDVNLEGAKVVANEISSTGRQSLAIKTDVSKNKEVNDMVDTVLQKFGKIDILINNAGGSARERASLFCDSKEEVWDYVLGINLKGALNCSRAVINHMIKRRYGKIVSTASIDGIVGQAGLTDYSAAKGGIIAFTKALAKEVGSYGINVNCISPGVIDTPALARLSPHLIEAVKKDIILGRLGKPEDIANAVIFLVSDESNWITGINLMVTGGGVIV